MIEFHHVTRKYDEEVALDDCSLKISQGEMLVLLGASGTGKSTFLKMISFEDRPTSGEVVVGAFRSSTARDAQVRALRRGLGIVHQDFKLLQDRSVFENVALPLRVAGLTRKDMHSRVEEVLERVELPRMGAKMPGQLSGGQRQRVAVARALVHKPAVLLADEPTGNLDHEMSVRIVGIFRELRASGTAVVLATYDLNLIQPEDRVVRMDSGRMKEGR